jgi:hypothetical protein
MELQQGIATALTVEAKDDGVNVSSHRAAEVAQVAPGVFFDRSPRVDPTDFQSLPSRQCATVELQ